MDNPPEKDMKDFEFIQLCKFRVSPPAQNVPSQRCKWLACSSTYGLLIYGTKDGFSAVKTGNLMAIDEQLGKERNKKVIDDLPVEMKVSLGARVVSMDISGDGLYLAIVTSDQGQPSILYYDVRSFADKTSSPSPFAVSQVSGAVVDISWNPSVSTMLAVCTSDGAVELIDVADKPKIIASLPASTGASCFSWSPKGKQLLVGRKDGSLSQYDHALAEKKRWPCPNVLSSPHGVVDVLWQSTHVFIAAYLPQGSTDQPTVVLTSASKDATAHINFEDICFGNGNERQHQYFFHQVLKWEMILMASSNATETTVVGKNLDDKISWEHWNLDETSRAQMPLTDQSSDSFPIGLAVDYSPYKPITISVIKQLPACPVMYLLSTDGMLIGYYLSYTHKDATPTTIPPQALTAAGARKGVPGLVKPALLQTPQTTPAVVAPQATPVQMTLQAPPFQATATPSIPAAVTPQMTSIFGLSQNSGLFGKQGSPAAPTSTPTVVPGFSTLNTNNSSFQFAGLGNKISAQAVPQASTFGSVPFSVPFTTSTPSSDPAKPVPQQGIFGPGFQTASPAAGVGVAGLTPKATTTLFGVIQTPSSSEANPLSGVPQQNVFGTSSATPSAGLSAFTTRTTPQGQGQTGPSLFTPGGGAAPTVVAATKPTSTAVSTPLSLPKPTLAQAGKTLFSGGPAATASQPQQPQAPSASIESTVDSAFTQNIFEEINDFEKELKELKIRCRKNFSLVGTDKEKESLSLETEKLYHFCQEIQETTKEQLREAQDQKSMCFHLFAMVEECKMKHERDTDPHYHSLLQSRVLDPASATKMKSLQQMVQTIEHSIVEVDRVLDAKWQEHVEKMKKEERLHTPTGDTIYKSIRNNNILIASQKQQLRKVEDQLRSLKLNAKISNRDLESVRLFNGDKLSPGKPEVTLTSRVAEGMTPEKISKLRDILSQRKVPRVKSTPAGNLSMSRIVYQTPGRSPGTTSTPERVEQRKHPLQTPTGPPASQLTAPTGALKFVNSQQKSETPKQETYYNKGRAAIIPGNSGQQPFPSGQQPFTSGQQPFTSGQQPITSLKSPISSVPQPAAPTAFSGVPHVHHHPQVIPPTKTVVPSPSLASRITPASPASSVTSSSQYTPGSTASYGLKQPDDKTKTPAANLSQFYEEVTETDETNDEDDYDEEDNGYEDEDEDEPGGASDEESVNFLQKTSPEQNAGKPAVLGSTGSSAFGRLGTGAGGFNFSTSSTPKVPQTTHSTQSFAPVKSSTLVPGASKDLFGAKSSLGDNGFKFGDTAQFPAPPQQPVNVKVPTSNLFGSMATPSRNVGFSDLSSKSGSDQADPDPGTTKVPSIFGGKSLTGESGKFTFGMAPTSTSDFSFATSASTPPTSGQATTPTDSKATPEGQSHARAASTEASSAQTSQVTSPSVMTTSAVPLTTTTTTSADSSTNQTTDSQKVSIFGLKKQDTSTTSAPQLGQSPGDSSTAASTGVSPSSSTSAGVGSQTPSTVGPTQTSSTNVLGTPQTGTITSTVFGTPQTTTTSTVFGTPQTNSTMSTVFGTSQSTTSTLFGTPQTGTTSIGFGNSQSTSSTLFGTPQASSVTSTVFGTPQTSTSSTGFGTSQSTGSTLFGTPQTGTTSTVFGTPQTSTSSTGFGTSQSTGSTLFGTPQTSTSAPSEGSSSGIFGTNTSSTGLFGKESESTSAFGTGTSTGFGSPSTFSFGQAATSSASKTVLGQSSNSAFGQSDNAQATTSLFGKPASSASSTGSTIFGQPASSTGSSLFGQPASSTSTSSLFGQPTSSTGSTLFGQPASSTGSSLFGQPASSTSTSSLFGQPTSSTGSSLFGQPASSTGTSLFGQPTSSTGSSLFGQPTSSTGSSLFGQPATSTGSTLFGQPTTSTTTSSLFGQPSVFGQPSGSSSAFGFGGLGGKPSEEKAKQNVFGTPQVFGNASTQSLFGGGGSISFGSPFSAGANAGGFSASSASAGGFSAGGVGIAATGFNVSSQQTTGTPSAFGSAPSFGSSPVFGSKPSFGASPSFGAPPAFGAAPSFSGLNTGSFGNSSSMNTGFSGFASSAAPTFDQLAQASPSSTSFGGGGFGSPASQPFGGSAPLFGQSNPSSGFGSQPQGFSSPSFGNNPAFNSYRG